MPNSREKVYGFGLGHPRLNPEGTFKVFCKADEGLCLAVRGGALVLATADPTDEHQHWFKDVHFSLRIKDEEGKPVFSLINKATGFAIQHSLGPGHPVRLVKFNPEDFEESVLWTESGHLGRDFGRIRMLYDVNLGLDALPGNEDGGGGVRDGTVITLTERAEGDTQSWKILYWSDEANETCGGLYNEPTCRIYCKANMAFSLTVRNGTVCLAPTDINDKYQEWIEDTRLGDMIKDQEGYPAFALINCATGDAIHASAVKGNPVKSSAVGALFGFLLELKPYNLTYVDEFRLWTKSRDMGEGFRFDQWEYHDS
uniref:PH domain-containing protein n=1 Tax=Oryza meridionalis TaxID=40149 RepID=A0A0E0F570_9ORYZ